MSVFKHLKYQVAIEDFFEIRKERGPERWTKRKLAEVTGIQASFLTNVLKGRFDFNADQLYAICEALGFLEPERDYLLLLLEYQRSTYPARKKDLKARIDEIRRKSLNTEKHIAARTIGSSSRDLAEYYLDPFVQLAHVHLPLSPFDKNPDLLCGALGISEAHLRKILEALVRIGYVEPSGKTYRVIAQNKHLPKENPLCDPHQALMRLKSIDQLSRLKNDEKYSFSVTLSGTDETKADLQREFLSFLKKAETIVKAADARKVFQMNFDLFSWKI